MRFRAPKASLNLRDFFLSVCVCGRVFFFFFFFLICRVVFGPFAGFEGCVVQ